MAVAGSRSRSKLDLLHNTGIMNPVKCPNPELKRGKNHLKLTYVNEFQNLTVPAGDPDIDQQKCYTAPPQHRVTTTTPAAAWVLLSLYLLYCLQKTYSESVVREEISEHVTKTARQTDKRKKVCFKRYLALPQLVYIFYFYSIVHYI